METKCIYPYCKEKVTEQTNLPVGKIVEGLIELTEDKKDCCLCKYHSLLAKEGMMGLVNQEGLIILDGPFPVIELIEKILKVKESLK